MIIKKLLLTVNKKKIIIKYFQSRVLKKNCKRYILIRKKIYIFTGELFKFREAKFKHSSRGNCKWDDGLLQQIEIGI